MEQDKSFIVGYDPGTKGYQEVKFCNISVANS